MLLSVIIVSYNVRHFLDLCLHSVLRAAEGLSVEVIVVDNASADDSVTWMQTHFPQIRVIANPENTGFSKANNQGVAVAQGKYILFLNPDTVMPEDFFRKTLAYMEAHPEAGALGPRLIDGKGQFAPDAKKGFPSFSIALFKTIGLHKFFPKSRLINGYYAPHIGEYETAPAEVLSGCCMLVRREAIDQVGGAFDERFFMYCEDVDLNYRLAQGGWQNIYFPQTNLIHYKGESTRKATLSYIRIFNEALAAFVRKHYSKGSARVFIFLLHIGIAVRAVLGVVKALFRRLRLPLIDGGILLLTLAAVQSFWVISVKGIEPVDARLLWLTYPVYLLTWIFSLYLSGAYDPTYRPLRVVRGMLVGTVVALAFYGLLPPEMRYSRGVVVLGGITGTVALLAAHAILQKLGVTGQVPYDAAAREAVIVGNSKSAAEARSALQKIAGAPRVIGRVGEGEAALAPLTDLSGLAATAGVGEVIFCAADVSYEEMFEAMARCGPRYDYKIYLPGRTGFVGSNSSSTAGDLYTADLRFRLSDPSFRRKKRTFDVLTAAVLLLLVPFTFWLFRSPGGWLGALWAVLWGSKTFVGYGGTAVAGLPPVRESILPPWEVVKGYVPSGLVASALNRQYAMHYVPGRDFSLLWQNAGYLRRKKFS